MGRLARWSYGAYAGRRRHASAERSRQIFDHLVELIAPSGNNPTEYGPDGIDHRLFDVIATSGEEVWQAIRHRQDDFYRELGRRCVVFQWGKDDSFFEALDLEPVDDIEAAEFILLNGTEKDKFPSYEPTLQRAVERGLPMVCANGDFVSITPEGELVQCPGVLARRYEALGGFVRWHGKPTTGTYDIALDAGQDRTRVLAIGDLLHHDIGGAALNGMTLVY